jgi:hypothetical protein
VKFKSAILLFTTCLFLTSAFSGAGLVTKANKTACQTIATNNEPIIPFELVGNHIFLRATVGKSALLWFVLDTGDKYGVIDLARARMLGLQLQGEVPIGGGGEGVLKGSFVKDASFNLVGLDDLPQKLSLAMPLDNLARVAGHDFDGILGQDFIRQFVVDIDYVNRRLTLHDKDKFAYSGTGDAVPITINFGGHPQTSARLLENGRDPVEGTFVLDIGYGGSLIVNKAFVEKQGLLRADKKTVAAIAGIGAGGESKALVGRVDGVKLGRFLIENPVVAFSQDTKGAAATLNVIGADILKQFRIILDYGRNRIILEPNSLFANPIEFDKSGLHLTTLGGDYREFRVMSIIDGSPASEAGIQKGDMLVAIDGKPAAQFTLAQIHEMLKQEIQFNLRFKRGDESIDIKLKLRRLV